MRNRKRARNLLVLVALVGGLLAPAQGFASEPILVVRNVQYGLGDGEPLLLDAYYSPTAENRPVVMLVHGGSWRRGDKSDWARFAPDFVDAGYTVLVPNYRLAPPNGTTFFPGPSVDLATAVRWTRGNAGLFGGDPARVGMLGTSAGGHLSLLSAGSNVDRPDVVGAFSAPVSLRSLYRKGILRYNIKNFLGCRPVVCPGTYRSANPANAAASSPPAFLAYSRSETIPVRQGRIMAANLAEAGIGHALLVRDGEAHGLGLARRTLPETLSFLQENL